MPRNMTNQYEHVQMFKRISKQCEQNHEIVDDVVHTFWELVWTFESTQKMWTILFKYKKCCPRFLEINMNIWIYV